ncbi:MAG: CoA pyrophosphatase [Flavobacteriaceae bacterium]|nr:CoA pyrophosphatase [Flavobacteriaceae bacterium]
MDFDQFKALISKSDQAALGGLESHKKMIPKHRMLHQASDIAKMQPKKAAVLALFYPNNRKETYFLLILRAHYIGTHASQISFPGGKFEKKDKNLKNTALRESFEEVGIDINEVAIKKQMTETFIPPSNFLVSPFIGILNSTPTFKPNHEVEQLIEVKLTDLLNNNSIGIKNLSTSYMKNIDVPCFKLNNYTVWGATAMMLHEIKDLLESL